MGIHDIHAAQYLDEAGSVHEIIIMSRRGFQRLVRDIAEAGETFTRGTGSMILEELEPGSGWMTLRVDEAGRVTDVIDDSAPPGAPAEAVTAWYEALAEARYVCDGIIGVEGEGWAARLRLPDGYARHASSPYGTVSPLDLETEAGEH
jgi:hypothetical protein